MPSKKKAPATKKPQATRLLELARQKHDGSGNSFARSMGKQTIATEARKATKMK